MNYEADIYSYCQEHWEYWKKNDPNITKRIKKLLADILEHPYTGIGKPEPLK